MRLPTSEDEAKRMLGIAFRASERHSEAAIYLMGEGVFWAKGLMPRKCLSMALDRGADVKASKRDLLARGISESAIEQRIRLLDDLEGELVEDAMGKAHRVVSW
jgi:sulfur relay protein TusB/DsrH